MLSILILLLLIIGLHRFYIYIQQDLWNGERAAVERAVREAGLTEHTKVWKSVWDEVCYVIEGKNENGQDVMIWLLEGKEPEVRLLSSGVSEDQINSIVRDTLPGIKVVRLLPGVYNSQLVWQLFYKQEDHYYYRFFSYSTGDPLPEVFTLPNR